MAISKAKKARQKLAQQGRITPDLLRGTWQGINPTMKRTPNLQEKQAKLNKKHRRNHAIDGDGSFCVYKDDMAECKKKKGNHCADISA